MLSEEELTKEEEDLCYKLAQKIDKYDEDKDGCYWGHILEIVEKIYSKSKQERNAEVKQVIDNIDELEICQVQSINGAIKLKRELLQKLGFGEEKDTIRNKKKDGKWGRGYPRRNKKQEDEDAKSKNN